MSDTAMLGESGYERREGEGYYTEPWVTQALLDNWPIRGPVWEPAAGRGDMKEVLEAGGWRCVASDLWTGVDFLHEPLPDTSPINSIITNPPYTLAEEFVRHAIALMEPWRGQVAMLLRNEWDSAKTRKDLFERRDFACKLVLTKRPRWDWWERDKPKASPRHNFAWFIWDGQHKGPPTIRWAP